MYRHSFFLLFLNRNQVLFGFIIYGMFSVFGQIANDRNVTELNSPVNYRLYYIYFYIYILWILPISFAQVAVEIDKRVMFSYDIHCGRCELFDSVYLYAES